MDDFATLLSAARAGDGRAWTSLYDRIAPVVLSYLRSQRAPDPEDLTGEVLLQVVRDLDHFRGDEANLRSWVLTIAHHRLIDARRYHQRRPVEPTDTGELPALRSDEDVAGTVLAGEGLAAALAMLDALTEEQRTVVVLREVHDLPVRDVAAVIGKRTGAVKALHHRAMTTLRERLEVAAVPPTGVRSTHTGARAEGVA